MSSRLRALIWDVDGTLAETERDGHRLAFNDAFAAAGLHWRWDECRYGELLEVAGGRERLLHDIPAHADAPTDPGARERLAAHLHALKTRFYGERLARDGVPLRPGVTELLEDCRAAGVRLAIATTTTGANVGALLRRPLGAGWRGRFDAVVCAEKAPRKKPDSQVYEVALAMLQLAGVEALAMEDSPAGAAAARAAAVPVVVTCSEYFADAEVGPVLARGPSLGSGVGWQPAARVPEARIDLAQLAAWHAAV